MTRPRALLACAYLALLAGIAIAMWKMKPSADSLDHGLQMLLDEPAIDDPEHKSTFFRTLAAIAKNNNQALQDYIPDWDYADEGYAFILEQRYVVVVVRGWIHCIPGEVTQTLVLLDNSGRILDSIRCTISSRLVGESMDGSLLTELTGSTDQDDGTLAIRYLPARSEAWRGDWSHDVTYQGRIYTFPWQPYRQRAVSAADF